MNHAPLLRLKKSPAGGEYLRLQRQCKCGASQSTLTGTCEECAGKQLQPSLTVGPIDDAYEREADRVADAVLHAPAGGHAVVGPIRPLVQRSDAHAGDRAGGVPASVHSVLAGSGQPLGAETRAYFEPRFGHDFSRVRVHHDSAAADSARAVDAHAYTVGEHIVFGTGRYAPADAAGRKLLAHELTHVVQQQGAVLRRASIDPPVTGSLRGEEEPKPPGTRQAQSDEDQPMLRLQRVPAIVGLDEAGPKADLSGKDEGLKLEKIGECLKGKGPDPNECSPTAPLTWADFTATPVASSPFGAVTSSTIKKKDVPSQQCIDEVLGRPTGPKRIFQGVFDPGKSWVKAKHKNATDPAKNGSNTLAHQCRNDFDAAAAKGQVGVTWALRTAVDPTCPASPRPAGTPATKKAECDTTIVADNTAQAVAESARLLNHEQFHFNLSCTLAKKANALLWRGGDFAAIDATIVTTLNAAQALYDGESNHGCIGAVQSKWQTEITAGLPSMKLP
ncbi:DUF4157 domain-containing protein [Variovorax sp. YR216]|uniref:eCIS core domain-containing protein n=1 Tax=Variovorax sp. YR216 TaxID=1882828 RepID=UPI00089B02C1|nr:DUF4157 domain-containing protein [Variovorax sp. YR216]SEB24308.1 protein of unknown function [Variovorax sp. YR216]